jgi:tRNA U34 5-methylaminomethyl-2-thiouridine-forming methyltransferase MnmC
MKSFFERRIVITEDGSSSIYLPAFDEHYHSSHGAVQESKHVFMEMGWKFLAEKQDEISMLEVGFGTGLNAFLVLQECIRNSAKQVHYTTLEAYPVSAEDAEKLNYAADPASKESFLDLHRAAWNNTEKINPNFTLEKLHTPLQEFSPAENTFDLVFFDAFAPRVQPELWTEQVFTKLFHAMKNGGVLVTYCAKGDVRRNMIKAGFNVERLPGPPGKREMLRATKKK